MLTAETQYGVEVEGQSMILARRLRITMPAGVQEFTAKLASATPSAKITTDMPDGTKIVPGYAARAMDFTISDPDGIFDLFDINSVMFGKQIHKLMVDFDEYLYLEGSQGEIADDDWLNSFTGFVWSWQRPQDAKTLQVTCVDGRDLLRQGISVAAVVTAPPFNANLTGEFAIDHLLRQATIGGPRYVSSSPRPRSTCALSMTFRSSLAPDVGTLTSGATAPSFTTGKFGTAVEAADTTDYGMAGPLGADIVWQQWQSYSASYVILISPSGADDYRAFLAGPSDPDGHAQGVYVQIRGGVFGGDTYYWSTPISAGPHYLGVHVHQLLGSAAWTVTINLDGTIHSSGTLTASSARVGNVSLASLDSVHSVNGSLESFQAWTASSPSWDDAFVPTAVLDPSLNNLQVIPALSGDPWQAIQQIADAEQGFAGFDEDLVFQFRNRKTLKTSAPVRTLTASGFQPLSPQSDASALANHVTVGYAEWNFGARDTVWSLTAAWKVPKGGIPVVKTIPVEGLCAGIDQEFSQLPDPKSGATAGNSYYLVSGDKAGDTGHPGIDITAVQMSADTVRVTMINRSGSDAWLVSPFDYSDLTVGTPTLWLGGIPVTQADEVTVDRQWPPLNADGSGGAASSDFGDVQIGISGNGFIQDEDSARSLNVDVLSQLHRAPIMFRQVVIQPDARLQLGDKVILTDETSNIDEPMIIWGSDKEISISASQDGSDPKLVYTQTLDLRMVAGRPKGWILGRAGRSTLGVSTRI